MQNTLLLTGAGISNPARLPLSDELTERVLDGGWGEVGEVMVKWSDEVFRLSASPIVSYDPEAAHRVVCVLNALNELMESYYDRLCKRSVNYEDIYYAITAMSDALSGEHPTPLPIPFLKELQRKCFGCFSYDLDTVEGCNEAFNFLDLNVLCYIRDVVSESIKKADISIDASDYRLITGLAKSTPEQRLSVFSLNHDTVLEEVFDETSVTYVDGFDDTNEYMRYWDDSVYDSANVDCRIYKLHGAINWWSVRPVADSSSLLVIPKQCMPDSNFFLNKSGDLCEWQDSRPTFLAGTINKAQEYSSPIFQGLQHRFYAELSKADHVVICGYSFGDRVINNFLIGAFTNSKSKRCTVISPKAEASLNSAEGGICNLRGKWLKEGWFQLVSKGIEHVDSDELSR